MKTIDTRARIQLKNILFLTDFSPAADAAVPFAAEAARRFGANLYALHVRTPAVNPMTEPATWVALEKVADAEAAVQRATLLRSFAGLDPKVSVREGDLWSTLHEMIEKNKVDLIVLGTRGRSGLQKLILGSTAEEIFRQAPCAVLTVGPMSSGVLANGGRISEIVYATDFSPESAAAAAHALSLAQEFQAHLTLLHVITNEASGNLVHPAELVESSTRLLRSLVPLDAELWCDPRFVVMQGPPAEMILQAAKERNADLIVLGIRRPGGFPGASTHLPIATAHKVVSHAPCPVLTVRG
jgi:nucleotide-binding universal stress UspA family protein